MPASRAPPTRESAPSGLTTPRRGRVEHVPRIQETVYGTYTTRDHLLRALLRHTSWTVSTAHLVDCDESVLMSVSHKSRDGLCPKTRRGGVARRPRGTGTPPPTKSLPSHQCRTNPERDKEPRRPQVRAPQVGSSFGGDRNQRYSWTTPTSSEDRRLSRPELDLVSPGFPIPGPRFRPGHRGGTALPSPPWVRSPLRGKK